jgi:hypothetical protein
MASFVQTRFPALPLGVARAAAVTDRAMHPVTPTGRGVATLLLAAVVSALLVAANQIIGNWTEGHLLAAWIVLWSVAFAGLALLAGPLRRLVQQLRGRTAQWQGARRAAASDAQIWSVALMDGRVMADISRAMAQDAAQDVRGLG